MWPPPARKVNNRVNRRLEQYFSDQQCQRPAGVAGPVHVARYGLTQSAAAQKGRDSSALHFLGHAGAVEGKVDASVEKAEGIDVGIDTGDRTAVTDYLAHGLVFPEESLSF